jgi:hypothetical protein
MKVATESLALNFFAKSTPFQSRWISNHYRWTHTGRILMTS